MSSFRRCPAHQVHAKGVLIVAKKMRETKPQWDSPAADAFMLVHGQGSDTRGGLYGPPWEDYALTTDLYARMTGIELSPVEGILFMVAVKLSRLSYGLGQDFPVELLRDHFVDAIGYLDCAFGAMVHQPAQLEDEEQEDEDE